MSNNVHASGMGEDDNSDKRSECPECGSDYYDGKECSDCGYCYGEVET